MSDYPDEQTPDRPMVMAVGDVHGEFNRMALDMGRRGIGRPDAVLQVGDLETVRDQEDADELSGPSQYNQVKDFSEFMDGSGFLAPLPIETFFIGGNHETWSFLHQHDPAFDNDPEVAENLFYLGRVGITEITGLTVAHLSGVYGENSFDVHSDERLRWAKNMDWQKSRRTGHFRWDEFNDLVIESAGHDVDILLTHEWPATRFLEDGVREENEEYGVSPVGLLAESLEPTAHFAGHTHSAQPPVEYRRVGTTFVGLNRLNYNEWDAVMVEFSDRGNPTITPVGRGADPGPRPERPGEVPCQ